VQITISNNVVTFFIPAAIVNQSVGGVLITRVEYASPRGQAGTTFFFETRENGSLVASDQITVQ
jgi:hypothetical protein